MNDDKLLELILDKDSTRFIAELQHGAAPNQIVAGQSLLHWACSTGSQEISLALISFGADANMAGLEGETPLMVAAYSGDVVVVAALLRAGAKVNLASESGETPIMFAAKNGSPDVVRLLLASGAEPSAIDQQGRNALHYAVLEGDNAEALRILLDAHANFHASAGGHSVIDYAQRMARANCLRLLEERDRESPRSR